MNSTYCHVSSQIAEHCDDSETYCEECGDTMTFGDTAKTSHILYCDNSNAQDCVFTLDTETDEPI